jgi:hypothetical protein
MTLAAGTDFNGASNTWAADAKHSIAGTVNFMSANTNVAYLKRIQLIPGSVVQAYKPADIQKELAKCQRYYAKTFSQGTVPAQNTGIYLGTLSMVGNGGGSGAGGIATWSYPVAMREIPTLTTFSPANASADWYSPAGPHTVTQSPNVGKSAAAIGNGATTNISNYYIHVTLNARLS